MGSQVSELEGQSAMATRAPRQHLPHTQMDEFSHTMGFELVLRPSMAFEPMRPPLSALSHLTERMRDDMVTKVQFISFFGL